MGLFSWMKKKEKKQKKLEDLVIRIPLTGDENIDLENVFRMLRVDSKEHVDAILKSYSLHYHDDLDKNLECSVQFVLKEEREAAKLDIDGRDIMEKVMETTYVRREANGYNAPRHSLPVQDIPEMRAKSIAMCTKAGYSPAMSLPTLKEIELRPATEIAGRLHAIKALVLWLMVPSDELPDDKILGFINQNQLNNYLAEGEMKILQSSRDNAELRNAIGWKFENAWPLAWYFGFVEPEISGQMMDAEQMREILVNHSCGLDGNIEEWISKQEIVPEAQVIQKEDLFYCLHNAVRSAQIGDHGKVPDGFDPIGNGGVIHERRHSLSWMISKGTDWDQTDLST